MVNRRDRSMHIGSGLNTVSSMYRQQKGNNMKAPVSAENTFYTAETPKVYQIFTTDNMLWTGGNGTGLSYVNMRMIRRMKILWC